jgi:hypothetical protein
MAINRNWKEPQYSYDDIAEIYLECQEKWNYSLPDMYEIDIYSHYGAKMLGWAHAEGTPRKYAISLDISYMLAVADKNLDQLYTYEDLFREVVVHELCHIFMYARGMFREHHGPNFHYWMRKMGYTHNTTYVDSATPNNWPTKQERLAWLSRATR